MQLKSLYIKEFKILKDFRIKFPFDSKKYISVFIGANGSGKSTLFEAIAEIFSNLVLQQYPKFDFEIEYSIRHFSGKPREYPHSDVKGKNLLIKIRGKKDAPYFIQENDGNGFSSVGLNNVYPSNLPSKVVIYYSGLSEHMDLLCKKHEELQRKAFQEGDYLAQRTFFYYRPENFNMILLSLLSFEYGEIRNYIFDKLNITEVAGFSVKFKRPHKNWAKGKKSKNLWGAEGVIKEFGLTLNQFAKYSIPENNDNFLTFSFTSIKQLYALKDHYLSESKLFELLDMASYEGILDSISISLNKGEKKNSSVPSDREIVFDSSQLSEGEQQLLIIKGLTELLGQKNSLFLFDEPDTYLHPEWQRQFISEINTIVDNTTNAENHYLIATHSPNIVSGVQSECLFVMDKGEIKEVPFDSFGKNIETLLIDFFDVDGVRNKYVENLLSEVQEFVKNKMYDSPEFISKFQELKEILGPTAKEIVGINLEMAKVRK